jgi:hypothetical protein
MDSVKENRVRNVGNVLRILVLVFALVFAIHVLSIAEPTKVLLLGIGFIGIAILGRRIFKEDRKL